ncbi:DUF2975 domain-containing protein [Senegalia massiliensis]|uniref:DUF2975 domain-containing protein n=1 Tax=Senegalia massiliensis TaxID=1720316 RepID=UPI001030B35E|nr:DUF2975 domain-containing protein [Senegalia massiliensis]
MKTWMVNAFKVSIILIGVAVLLLFIFWLPNVSRRLAISNPEYAYLRYPLLFGLYITGIPFYMGIFHTFKLLKLIQGNSAFTKNACKSLGAIKIYAILVIAIYIIGMILISINNAIQFEVLVFGILIMFASFIIAIFSAILKELLRKAVEIKDENDFTI